MASKRECSREDNACCLMGIFGINMPLLYGEGENAFRRLQLEILKTSDDESLFAWWNRKDDLKLQTGLLTTSPQDVSDSADISPHPFYPYRAPYGMTNKGLKFEANLIPCKWPLEKEEVRPSSAREAGSPIGSATENAKLFSVEKNDHEFGNDPSRDGIYRHVNSRGPHHSDQNRPSRQTHTSTIGSTPAKSSLWIFPLNRRILPNRHPVVLILATWGSKIGQCCRLSSAKSTDLTFGPEWPQERREFANPAEIIYIWEADAGAR